MYCKNLPFFHILYFFREHYRLPKKIILYIAGDFVTKSVILEKTRSKIKRGVLSHAVSVASVM
jgi:hypothetical protein